MTNPASSRVERTSRTGSAGASGGAAAGKTIKVGFAQTGSESGWRAANTKSMKEAFSKAMGTGIRAPVNWQNVWVGSEPTRLPGRSTYNYRGGDFDGQPGFKAVLVSKDAAHFRAGVARNHGETTIVS